MATPLNQFAADDYQKRGDGYPKSNIPNDIQVNGNHITATFKNTTEGAAKKWLQAHLIRHGHTIVGEISTGQDGDYHDDWVSAGAHVKEV